MNKSSYEHILFKTVKCSAYLKEARDGAHIDETEDGFYFCKGNIRRRLLYPGDGGEKIYYERKETLFSGVIVGVKEIVIKGRLYVGETRDANGIVLNRFVNKEATKTHAAALVYYQNLRKRWVLLRDIMNAQINQLQIPLDLEIKEKQGISSDKQKNPYVEIIPDPCPAFRALPDDDIPF